MMGMFPALKQVHFIVCKLCRNAKELQKKKRFPERKEIKPLLSVLWRHPQAWAKQPGDTQMPRPQDPTWARPATSAHLPCVH